VPVQTCYDEETAENKPTSAQSVIAF